jgi:hypothetical protein
MVPRSLPFAGLIGEALRVPSRLIRRGIGSNRRLQREHTNGRRDKSTCRPQALEPTAERDVCETYHAATVNRAWGRSTEPPDMKRNESAAPTSADGDS